METLQSLLESGKNATVIINLENKIIYFSGNSSLARDEQDKLMEQGFKGDLWRASMKYDTEYNEYVLDYLYEFTQTMSNAVQLIERYEKLSEDNVLSEKSN